MRGLQTGRLRQYVMLIVVGTVGLFVLASCFLERAGVRAEVECQHATVMTNPYVVPLSLVVFLPALGALALAFFPKDRPETVKRFSLFITIVDVRADGLAGMHARRRRASRIRHVRHRPWPACKNVLDSLDPFVQHLLFHGHRRHQLSAGDPDVVRQHGGDGGQLADHKSVKAYCILFLLLETGMLGVFLALDFFLFYVFWEVMLLPMYFLIGVWGGPRREYAAIKFFLYTLLGSVLMLIAILMLYFNSDLRTLSPEQLDARRRSSRLPADAASASKSARDAAAHVQHPGPAANGPAHRIRRSTTSCCSARASAGGRSCCCSSASPSRCRRCRCTPGCPTRTSKPPRRSR